jgi:pilus assembly protein Flp/PilA
MTIKKHAAFFWQDESGLTMVEYAVAGSLITLAAATAFQFLGYTVFIKVFELAALLGLT